MTSTVPGVPGPGLPLLLHGLIACRARIAPALLLVAALAFPAGAWAICSDDDQCTYPKVCRNNFCVNSDLPNCSDICNITTSCTTPCLLGTMNRTCGAYGNCYLAPCSSVCSASTSCATACEMDGFRSNCSLQGACAGSAIGSCVTDSCLNGSCRKPLYGVDGDLDGVPDRLEYEIALAYFPNIMLQTVDHDLSQTYTYDSHPMPYRVHAITSPSLCAEAYQCLEIRFGTAYWSDYGDPTFGGGHLGDGEFYAAVVRRTTSWTQASTSTGDWQLIRDFTAAHWTELTDGSVFGEYGNCPVGCNTTTAAVCQSNSRCFWFAGFCMGTHDAAGYSCSPNYTYEQCGSAGGDCFWLSERCLTRGICYSSTPVSGRRTLYAAEGKHALYHSDAECDTGNFIPWLGAIDECPSNAYNWRTYVDGRLQNVGEGVAGEPFDHWIQHPDRCHLYDVWGDALFGQSSRYKEKFQNPFIWDLP